MNATMTLPLTSTDHLLDVSHELHQFLTNLQRPRLSDRTWAEAARARCGELSARISTIRESVAEHHRSFCHALEGLSGSLRAYAYELENSANVARLRELYQGLAQAYELMRVELREVRAHPATGETLRLRRLKTTNYKRNVFHMLVALSAVLLYQLVLTRWQAVALVGSCVGLFAFLEVIRRFLPRANDFMVDRLFGAISRPWERHQVNSATYYTVGLLIVAALFSRPAALLGVLVLGFGDPAATVAGKRWGRRKIWKEKSYVGTGAFLAASLAATLVYLAWTAGSMPWGSRLALAFSVSGAGALTELFTGRVDDNLTVPVVCAAVASALLPFLGNAG